MQPCNSSAKARFHRVEVAIDEKGVSFIKGSTDLGSKMPDLQKVLTLLFLIVDTCAPGWKEVL